MPRASGSKMMMQDASDMKSGMHRMPDGSMMRNSMMKRKKGKKSKYAGMMMGAKGY